MHSQRHTLYDSSMVHTFNVTYASHVNLNSMETAFKRKEKCIFFFYRHDENGMRQIMWYCWRNITMQFYFRDPSDIAMKFQFFWYSFYCALTKFTIYLILFRWKKDSQHTQKCFFLLLYLLLFSLFLLFSFCALKAKHHQNK